MKSRAEHGGVYDMRSRPTRGAWIEIARKKQKEREKAVAPHTGRVD